MTNLIIGNLCSLLAMITDSISSSRKTTRGVLLMQSLSQAIYFVAAIFLKGYSAAVQNAVSILRNFVAIQKVHYKWLEYFFVVLGVVLGLYFNNLGFIGLLPVVANLQYSIAVFKFKENERALKKSFLACVIMFTVFNLVILNIVGMASNIVVAVSTTVFLVKTKNN